MVSTVASVIHANLEDLNARLAEIRDGDHDAIHDGRVATRRLRAALPLVGSTKDSEEIAAATAIVRTLGRALGKARDTDVALALLDDIERRSPDTAPATASMRARLLPKQLRQRRRVIKTLESLDLDGLGRLHATLKRDGRTVRSQLAAAVGAYADAATKKIDHASGVYFPNRAHYARVAIKKLRYAAELIDRAGGVRKPALRALRKAQDILGRIHDREMLLRRLRVQAKEEPLPAARALARVLEAESRVIFEEYLALRRDVTDACEHLAAWARHVDGSLRAPRLLVVGAVALPPVIWLAVRRYAAPYESSSSRTRRPAIRAASVS